MDRFRAALTVIVLVGSLAPAGCHSVATTDGWDDRDLSVDARLVRARRLDLTQDRVWRAVSGVAWSRAEPSRLRIGLLAALRAHHVERFWTEAGGPLAGEPDGAVVSSVLAWAWQDGDRASGAVLRRWAALRLAERAATDEAATFAAALGVAPGAGERVHGVLRAWLNSDRPVRSRIAAWQVLWSDVDRRRETRDWLIGLEPASPLAIDLNYAARTFGELPVRPAELTALSVLRSRDAGRAWRQIEIDMGPTYTRHAGRVFPETIRAGFALRHVGLLRLAEGDPEVVARWAVNAERKFQFPLGRSPVSYHDGALVGCLAGVLRSEEALRLLFVQADADHADGLSEHGGLVALDASESGGVSVVFRSYPPWRRVHDRAYHASPSLVMESAGALATYHFHAERHVNAEHAGPGAGDMRSVEATGMAMVVLTFLDRDTLSVTAALPGGAVVDLGEITRP